MSMMLMTTLSMMKILTVRATILLLMLIYIYESDNSGDTIIYNFDINCRLLLISVTIIPMVIKINGHI